jgi:hypothetical protein
MKVRATASQLQTEIYRTKSLAKREKVTSFMYFDSANSRYAIVKRGTAIAGVNNWENLKYPEVKWKRCVRYKGPSFDFSCQVIGTPDSMATS